MFPRYATHNIANNTLRYAVIAPKLALRNFALCVTSANFYYLFIGQFAVSRSFSHLLSPLFYFVGSIISVCSQKQVRGVYAKRVVASMAYAESIGDRADAQSKCYPMCFPRDSRKHKLTIARCANTRLPLPALIRADHVGQLYFVPEALYVFCCIIGYHSFDSITVRGPLGIAVPRTAI